MKVRARWPLPLLGLIVFGTAASIPLRIAPSPEMVVPTVAVDPDVERVARYLEWRAPVSIDPLLRRQVSAAVVEEARRVGFDPFYILAVMEVESDFVPEAVSSANARGLLQLRDVTIEEISRHEVLPAQAALEPETVVQLRFGIRYLARLEERFRDRTRALAAWNAGPAAVRKALRETGKVPERWLAFARNVEKEHRRILARIARAERQPTTVAQAPTAAAPVAN